QLAGRNVRGRTKKGSPHRRQLRRKLLIAAAVAAFVPLSVFAAPAASAAPCPPLESSGCQDCLRANNYWRASCAPRHPCWGMTHVTMPASWGDPDHAGGGTGT